MGLREVSCQVALILLTASFIEQGSCGTLQCDGASVTSCVHDFIRPLDDIVRKLAEREHKEEGVWAACLEVSDLLTCTERLTVSGCPDETKELAQNFVNRSSRMRGLLCQSSGQHSLDELNKCIDAKIGKTCEEGVDRRASEDSESGASESDVGCRLIRNKMDCWLTATVGCSPSAGLGREVLESYFLSALDVRHCPNSGFISAPVTWLTLGALGALVSLLL